MHVLRQQTASLTPPARAAVGRRAQVSLTVSEPGDRLERDADRAAEQALRSPPTRDSLPCACGGGCPRCSVAPAVSGGPLDTESRRFFEPRFNADFSQVRVHSDAAAAASARGLNADAYTTGNDIVFGAGRYVPGTPAGRRLLAHELAHVAQQARGMTADASGPVIHRKKVGTDFGEFESTNFTAHASGVEITLLFHPDKAKVDATKIAMVQSVKATNESGKAYAVNPSIAGRMVPKGKPGAGFAIDASGETNNPLYFDLPNLSPSQDLKDTPGPSAAQPQVGVNTHYDFGHCYKLKPTDADKSTHPAGLHDKPEGMATKGAGMAFETTALAIDGADKNTYYGSVKWSYKMAKKAGALVAVGTDIAKASAGTPTANFTAPAKLWNTGTARGTLVVAPASRQNKKDAFVQNVTTGKNERLAAGTLLEQIRAIKGGTEGMIEAEVLDASGAGTGTIVYIYVGDVKDKGDGTANKPLP
ncbi:DUF4157 domain-containing protein [Piscinibacter sp.]|uniref:eCIS core domain-containing protein n=1 Tax=Piscinibacter sp. TaxID=1903157 RepID=UPI002B7DE83E|nr:DUF4157 domain-containing protein [Albitalea sp.]HUG25837.1 DUF4157 domain-containing protein [Albitalea sp.]